MLKENPQNRKYRNDMAKLTIKNEISYNLRVFLNGRFEIREKLLNFSLYTGIDFIWV